MSRTAKKIIKKYLRKSKNKMSKIKSSKQGLMWTAVTRSVSCPSNQETKETKEIKENEKKKTK